MGAPWRTLVHGACFLLTCAEFYSWCALQHQARRPSERDFHRARLEVFRTNYEALLAELGSCVGLAADTGRGRQHAPCDTDTHETSGALKRRR